MNGEFTYTEIMNQPAAWSDALAAFAAAAPALTQAWQSRKPAQVIFTGCGSTHYLALTAAALFQQLTGVPSRGGAASELLLFGKSVLSDPAHTLLVAVSRSGTTTETLTAVSRFQQQGGLAVWTITCHPDSPLAQLSDIVLPAAAAQEQSVAQTRSFASMLLLAQALAAHLGREDWTALNRLPGDCHDLLARAEPIVQHLVQQDNRTHFTFLGSGPQFGVASEAMLKMIEMSLTTANAFHFLEYRHGPMSMAGEEIVIVGLLSPRAATQEHQVLNEMAAKGAVILSLGVERGDIALSGRLPDWSYPLLYLPPLQLLAYHQAILKGLDPDNPPHLTTVIYLDAAEF